MNRNTLTPPPSLEVSPADYLQPHLLRALQMEEAPTIASYLAFEVLWLSKDIFGLEQARRQWQRAELPRHVVLRGGERPIRIPRAGMKDILDFQDRHRRPQIVSGKSPLFSEEPGYLVDGQLHSSAQYTQFRLSPAPYVSLQAFYRSYNTETGKTTDAAFLDILVDHEAHTSEVEEGGRQLQSDDEMFFPLSVVLNARRAVLLDRQQISQ